MHRMQSFYRNHAALVTSPFITLEGAVDNSLLEEVFRELEIPAERGPVLDIGCGSGLLSTVFEKNKIPYVGLDINVHSNFPKLRSERVRFIQGSSLELPFQNGIFRLITCVDSFEHYPDQVQAAREMRRVLHPDGRVYLSVPNYKNVAGWVKKRMERSGKYPRDGWAPFDYWKPQELEQFMTPERVRSVFSDAGFRRFRMVGIARELCFGLIPWLWHPKCPFKIIHGVMFLFRLFQKPVVRRFPHLSLHTLWSIS
jgi:SAM-dependent methyltransferase